ncbi:hypothetical protein BRD00_04265 [Halobacteriales archaeon QS_8_69_26]|nr:MAG: hypothetical protein BRD00_04265 [Halobacteriales archaeon QS_8_69_26]
MAECDICGDGPGKYAYDCHRCGGEHCSDHRLPEHHDCPGLADPAESEAVLDPDRSSARQRHEVIQAGGVARPDGSDRSPLDRPVVRYALVALAALVAVGVLFLVLV